MSKVDILDVKVDKVSMMEAVGRVEGWLKGKGRHYIVTPNPEFIMAAQKDPEFKKVLNEADLSIPDGSGFRLVTHFDIVPGVDLMEELVKVAADQGAATGFLGGREGVAEKCAECLQKKYPKLKVSFAGEGGEIDSDGKSPKQLKLPKIDILFVAFGQVKQEKWIAKNLPNLDVKVAMGVGGSFDYLSGSVPRAPKWMRRLGLEWLFRLILQPWRIKRQLALIKFAWLILFSKS